MPFKYVFVIPNNAVDLKLFSIVYSKNTENFACQLIFRLYIVPFIFCVAIQAFQLVLVVLVIDPLISSTLFLLDSQTFKIISKIRLF